MKYLKTFESNSDPLYSFISQSEYYSMVGGDCEKFTQNELDGLIDLGDKYEWAVELSDDNPPKGAVINFFKYTQFGNIDNRFVIRKLEDEWYLVRVGPGVSYWKCDQFDGLVDCLRDKIIPYY